MWLKKLAAKPSPPAAASSPIPTVTPAVIAEARRKPNGWVYAMDGITDPNAAVPPERSRGAWKVNANGQIEGKFIPNPKYQPPGRSS